jgi:uncharacterized membrane protein YdbT with pleckstrin-like domain
MRFSIKPVFVGWVALLVQLPFQIFLTFWCGGFLGAMLGFLFPDRNTAQFFFGALAFIGIPLCTYIARKYNYSRTEYRFYDDRLEFEEGFFTIQKKTIRFKDVKEITLRRGILQRANGLGTVYMATLATGAAPYSNPFTLFGFGNASASGINVRDIPDPENNYTKIRAMVDAAN